MVELLLNDYIPEVWIIRIIGFATFLSGEIYFTSSLIPLISSAASSAIIVIVVNISLGPSPSILLESFRHTVLLEMSYFIASPVSNIDTSSWPGSRILLFLFLS